MDNMDNDLPSQKDILVPFLKVLDSSSTEMSIHAITDQLSDVFKLSDIARNRRYLHSGELIFYNVIRFVRLTLSKAGLIESTRRGFVKITNKGSTWLQQNPGATRIDRDTLQNLEAVIKPDTQLLPDSRLETESPAFSEDSDPLSDMDKAYNQIHTKLKNDLYRSVMDCTPYYFEKVVVDLLINLGYGGSKREAGQAFSRSKDEGVDGVINEDRLGLDKIYVQAKKWGKDTIVGRPEVQKFIGALAGKSVKKGVFITTSSFTRDALEYAQNKTADYKIILIDKIKLIDYMIESDTGVLEDNNYSLPIKKIDYDYFEDED